MTIERPMFPPRAESVDSFLPQTAIGQRERERRVSESRKASAPALTLVGGTAVLRTPAPRKARATAAEREAKAIQAGEMIERLLPAYVELHRLWAKGSAKAHAYVDANFSEEERYDVPKGAAHTTLRSIYASSGADTAQRAMNGFCRKIAPLVRLIEAAPAETMEGLRAKALAAMYECVPGIGDHSGFDFEDGPPAYEMLFRACIPVTGLSKLATEIESRLQGVRL